MALAHMPYPLELGCKKSGIISAEIVPSGSRKLEVRSKYVIPFFLPNAEILWLTSVICFRLGVSGF